MEGSWRHMSSPSQDNALVRSQTRYLAWLERRFVGLDEKTRQIGIRKWMAIYQWHKAERAVWRCLYDLSTRKTKEAKAASLMRLQEVYALRNKYFTKAVEAHWPCSHLNFPRDTSIPKDVLDMFLRHPGFYPTRL